QGPACLPAGKLVRLKDFAEKRSVASSQYVKIPAKWAGLPVQAGLIITATSQRSHGYTVNERMFVT
ncbi:MAG: hypothetical protein WAU01_04975, partial [Saprospiraceae bacterium]